MTRRHERGEDRDAAGTDDSVEHDALVELTRVSFIAEAIAIQQDLERVGIAATVFPSDAGGWVPYLSVEGNRVMIHARDLDRARELLSDVGGQLASDDPLSPTSEVRKHLRPHGTGSNG